MIEENITRLKLIENNREDVPMQDNGLRFLCCKSTQKNFPGGAVPWHWHTEMEIDFIERGTVEIQTAEKNVEFHEGDAIFINAGVLHGYKILTKEDFCYYSILFDASFVCGTYGNLLDIKYMHPIQQCRDLMIYGVRATNFAGIHMMRHISSIIELCRDEPFAYEFEVRSELSRFWALLFQNTEEIRAQNTEKNNSDMERLKEMILYIQANYAERIMLDDIAAAAGISPRECMRCFQRCLGNSPVNYLNDHRLHMAAEKLLTTAETVTEVSENCGFSSVSYFSKAFRLKMGCTPLEYRKGKDTARE